jgi:Uncharacterised nucleotidyltransferase
LAAAAHLRHGPVPLGPAKQPEFELLLASCGKSVRDSELAALLRSPIKWERLLSLAEQHCVIPAVFNLLQDRPEVPASIQSAVKARFQRNVRNALRLSATLSGILQKFESSGIEVLPHKGPVLAKLLFGDVTMRQFGDLDLLIRGGDIPRARAALQELGYEPNLLLSARQERAYLRSGYEYVFGCDAAKYLIELQWQILPRFYSVGFDMDALFARSVETEFEGQRARMLRKEDLMLVTCVHAAKHEWSRLGMLRDIAALARFDLDWTQVEHEVRRLGIVRIVLISLLLARDLLGYQLPDIFGVGHDIGICEQLANGFQRRLRNGDQPDTDSLDYFRTMLRLRERWQDRARFAVRLAITPSVREWHSLSIPDRLFPMYRVVRGIRLLRRFCTRA